MSFLSNNVTTSNLSEVKINDNMTVPILLSQETKEGHFPGHFITFSTNLGLIAGARLIANYLDPKGALKKRDFFHRFLTVTLAENGPIALGFWLGRIEKFEPDMLLAVPLLTIGTAKIFEVTRWVCASVIHQIPHSEAQELAAIVGPRDFYAR